jgi:hypothetical protein
MKRLRSGLAGSTVALGVGAMLAAGGGYAFATSNTTTNVIHGCVSKKDGALRIANTCTSTETALSWNKLGPPGPGAKRLVYYNGSPSPKANPVLRRVGSVGPWTIYGACVIDPSGNVFTDVFFTGPAFAEDRWGITGPYTIPPSSGAHPASTLSSPTLVESTGFGAGGNFPDGVLETWVSRAGKVEQNFVLTGKSLAGGNSVNSCHWSDVVTAVS